MNQVIATLEYQMSFAKGAFDKAAAELALTNEAIADGKLTVKKPSQIMAEQSFWSGQIAAYQSAIAAVRGMESN
jgi:hypothetical protein